MIVFNEDDIEKNLIEPLKEQGYAYFNDADSINMYLTPLCFYEGK